MIWAHSDLQQLGFEVLRKCFDLYKLYIFSYQSKRKKSILRLVVDFALPSLTEPLFYLRFYGLDYRFYTIKCWWVWKFRRRWILFLIANCFTSTVLWIEALFKIIANFAIIFHWFLKLNLEINKILCCNCFLIGHDSIKMLFRNFQRKSNGEAISRLYNCWFSNFKISSLEFNSVLWNMKLINKNTFKTSLTWCALGNYGFSIGSELFVSSYLWWLKTQYSVAHV